MISSLDSDFLLFRSALVLEKGLSANTVASYDSDLRFFAAFLARRGRVKSADVTRSDIVDFLADERAAGLRASTRKRRSAAIRSFFRCLRERHLIEVDPSELLEAPRKALVLPRVLSESEVARMLDGVDGEDPRSLRDRALMEIMYDCGLRVSEACALKMEDVVGEADLLRILGKGSKERLVPFGGAAARALSAYLAEGREAFARGDLSERHVFLTRRGGAFTRQGVFKVIRERAAAAGIEAERISPHVLRHCFASHLLARGADIRTVQELLGHASIATTQVYTHVNAENYREVHKLHPRHFIK